MFSPEEFEIIEHAKSIISSRMKTAKAFTSPDLVKNYCALNFACLERETFSLLLLDKQHRLIECVTLFVGTLDKASIYPREVVKECLLKNAGAVILTHNHPSGIAEPSQDDRRLTRRLKDCLEMVEISVLDHIVVGTEGQVSFLERGWM
ncbi:RadC family protein [Vibrio harveyi]|uniref:RadC family protein n=1 Tax=Vibrio harveyi TaxID=669 RepID=UPI003CE9E0E4